MPAERLDCPCSRSVWFLVPDDCVDRSMLAQVLKDGRRGCRRAAHRVRLRWRYQRGVRERLADLPGRAPRPAPELVRGHPMASIVERLDRDGFAVLEDFFDPEGLAGVLREMNVAMSRGVVLPVLRGRIGPDDERFLSPSEIARGDEYMRPRVPIVYLDEPFVTCPTSLRYVFSEDLIAIADAVHGCPSAFTAGKIMRSYGNDLPLLEFNEFHYDTQAHRILKFFLYLEDVGVGGGAFSYVTGSHRNKPQGAFTRGHLLDSEIEAYYGAHAMHELTARVGTLIITDTQGYHRATKPRRSDRSALLITTGVHRYPGPVHLPREAVERLDPHLRHFADFADGV